MNCWYAKIEHAQMLINIKLKPFFALFSVFLLTACFAKAQFQYKFRVRASPLVAREMKDSFRRPQELSVYGTSRIAYGYSVAAYSIFEEIIEAGLEFERTAGESLKLPEIPRPFRDFKYDITRFHFVLNYHPLRYARIRPFVELGTGLHFVFFDHGAFGYSIRDENFNIIFSEEREAKSERSLQTGLRLGLGMDLKLYDGLGVFLSVNYLHSFSSEMQILQEDLVGIDFRFGVMFNLFKNKYLFE